MICRALMGRAFIGRALMFRELMGHVLMECAFKCRALMSSALISSTLMSSALMDCTLMSIFSLVHSGLVYVDLLSIFDDKLLISYDNLAELFIYNREGRHLSTIKTNNNDKLYDATWTPRGSIVYTSRSKNVVVMSESGKVITTHTQMTEPRFLSVLYDNTIYLANWKTGVYQSTDDSVKWSLVFKSTDEWHIAYR